MGIVLGKNLAYNMGAFLDKKLALKIGGGGEAFLEGISHWTLFRKFIDRDVPLYLVMILWYCMVSKARNDSR